MSLARRNKLPELMDDPDLEPDRHDQALAGLARLNRVSRSGNLLWPSINRLARQTSSDRPLRVLDIACGGGDNVVALSRMAHESHVSLQIDGCDVSSHAVDYAGRFAQQYSPMQNQFFCIDVLRDPIPEGYDVLMCSLFLHHLDDRQALKLMRLMRQACRGAILVNDLRRTTLGYMMAWTCCRLFSRSPVVHIDGPRSVRAAFSEREVCEMANQAGLEHFKLSRKWPQRFLLSWYKP